MKYSEIEFIEMLHRDSDWFALSIKNHTTNCFNNNLVKTATEVDRFSGLISNKNFSNYVSLNGFCKKSRKEIWATNLNGFMFDFDDGDQAKIDRIAEELGKPSFLVNTTPSLNKWQCVYLFEAPKPTDKDAWKAVSFALTNYFESDHTFDAARVMRLPGSINGKVNELVGMVDNDIRYPFAYFEEFIIKKGISMEKMAQIEDLEPSTPTKKDPEPERQVNAEHSLFEEYSEWLVVKKGDRSKARAALISKMIGTWKWSDIIIRKECSSLGFDPRHTNRMISDFRDVMRGNKIRAKN